jgi:hypothetical protein
MTGASEVERDLPALIDRQDASPVRSSDGAHAGIVVMQLLSTGLIGCAASSAISRRVAAASGIPIWPSS